MKRKRSEEIEESGEVRFICLCGSPLLCCLSVYNHFALAIFIQNLLKCVFLQETQAQEEAKDNGGQEESEEQPDEDGSEKHV